MEAVENSGEKVPFWICATALYYCDESEELTVGEQLGPDPEPGPFAMVLKNVSLMIAIVTHVCDINTRLWYVYRMISLNML